MRDLYAVLSRSVLSNSLSDPWTVARQAPLSMEILQARILEWATMPSSRGLPNPGIKPRSPALLADSLPFELPAKPRSYGSSILIFEETSYCFP